MLTKPVGAFELNLDYWFIETFTLGAVVLPDGVTITTSDPATTPRGYLLLENKTKTLLFVLSLEYKDMLVMTTPDPNWKNRINGAHEVASYLASPDHAVVLEMEALADLDHALKDQNVLQYELAEETAPVPASQSSELLLVYGAQVIEVPFTISYSPNTEFDNGIEANREYMARAESTISATLKATQMAEETAVRAANTKTVGLGFLIVVKILILGWLVWRARRGLLHK